MALHVDLARLRALAEKIDGLNRDIGVLADNALSASGNVAERSNATPYGPLKTACKNVMNSTRDAKKTLGNIRGDLSHQSETLREAAARYERNDRIDAVNETR